MSPWSDLGLLSRIGNSTFGRRLAFRQLGIRGSVFDVVGNLARCQILRPLWCIGCDGMAGAIDVRVSRNHTLGAPHVLPITVIANPNR